MTMPKTATAVQRFGMALPQDMTDEQLAELRLCLDEDLPGAMDYVQRAAAATLQSGEFSYLAQAPGDMASRDEWDTLVSYLARLFASPFRAIVTEIMRRRYGVSVAFVNCCIIAGWLGDIDEDELWCLQSRMQLTPDC